MRILVCSNTYPPHFVGGAELIAHFQCKSLRREGHDVMVFAGESHSRNAHYQHSDDVYDGVPVRRVRLHAQDFSPAFANFSHPAVEQTFAALLDEFRPDLVHVHNVIGLSCSIVRMAHEWGAKTVVTLHDHWGFCFKNTAMKTEREPCVDFSACHECQEFVDDGRSRRIPIRFRQDYFTLFRDSVDAFVSPSRYLAGVYVSAGYPADRMHVVWNGIDVDRFSKIRRSRAEGEVRFSFLGHFGRHKGVHTMLEALPLLPAWARYRVNLVGGGEEREEYERILAASGCGRHVRFWGKIDNALVDEVYAETDVLILPSLWRENQPVCVTEAMASGCAVIASRTGGSVELVADGVSGFLYDAGDRAQLAGCMARFLDDPSLADRMGSEGRKRMADNSFAASARALTGIYRASTRNADPAGTYVVCIGETIDAAATGALPLLSEYCNGAPVRITMAEWLTLQQIRSAQALWVVDPSLPTDEVAEIASRHALPLIVPARNAELTRFCRESRCGLYYESADEAAACVAHLVNHEEHRRQLASSLRARTSGAVAP